MSIADFKRCWKHCSKITVHAQDDIISSCLPRNTPVDELKRNAIIADLDTKWKTAEFLASTAYCLPAPSKLSAPCLSEAAPWALITDSDFKITKLETTSCKDSWGKENQQTSFAQQQHLHQTFGSKRILPYQAWTHNSRFLLRGLENLLAQRAAGSWLSPLAWRDTGEVTTVCCGTNIKPCNVEIACELCGTISVTENILWSWGFLTGYFWFCSNRALSWAASSSSKKESVFPLLCKEPLSNGCLVALTACLVWALKHLLVMSWGPTQAHSCKITTMLEAPPGFSGITTAHSAHM